MGYNIPVVDYTFDDPARIPELVRMEAVRRAIRQGLAKCRIKAIYEANGGLVLVENDREVFLPNSGFTAITVGGNVENTRRVCGEILQSIGDPPDEHVVGPRVSNASARDRGWVRQENVVHTVPDDIQPRRAVRVNLDDEVGSFLIGVAPMNIMTTLPDTLQRDASCIFVPEDHPGLRLVSRETMVVGNVSIAELSRAQNNHRMGLSFNEVEARNLGHETPGNPLQSNAARTSKIPFNSTIVNDWRMAAMEMISKRPMAPFHSITCGSDGGFFALPGSGSFHGSYTSLPSKRGAEMLLEKHHPVPELVIPDIDTVGLGDSVLGTISGLLLSEKLKEHLHEKLHDQHAVNKAMCMVISIMSRLIPSLIARTHYSHLAHMKPYYVRQIIQELTAFVIEQIHKSYRNNNSVEFFHAPYDVRGIIWEGAMPSNLPPSAEV